MTDTLSISSLAGRDELARALAVFATALVHVDFAAVEDVEALYEPGRTLGGFLGEEMVATATSVTSWLTVPGGTRLPHAAVTDVAVLPTHTRRGFLSAVMGHQLDDIARRGEVVASLRASEGVIYERFGYGVASTRGRFALPRERARLRPTVAPGTPVSLILDLEAAEPVMREVCARMAWVGAIARPESWWVARQVWRALNPRPRHTAVAEGASGVEGFIVYGPPSGGGWSANPELKVVVEDLVALTEAAYIGLIRHVLALDLTRQIELHRPVDDPLPHLFSDPTAVRLTNTDDETWLRLVDVEAALAARTYNAAEPVIVAVTDPLLTANSGSYAIASSGAERVLDSSRAPDVSLDVATLAAAYLGGTRWADLALGGRAVEHRAGAINALDELFRTPRAPYAGTNF